MYKQYVYIYPCIIKSRLPALYGRQTVQCVIIDSEAKQKRRSLIAPAHSIDIFPAINSLQQAALHKLASIQFIASKFINIVLRKPNLNRQPEILAIIQYNQPIKRKKTKFIEESRKWQETRSK